MLHRGQFRSKTSKATPAPLLIGHRLGRSSEHFCQGSFLSPSSRRVSSPTGPRLCRCDARIIIHRRDVCPGSSLVLRLRDQGSPFKAARTGSGRRLDIISPDAKGCRKEEHDGRISASSRPTSATHTIVYFWERMRRTATRKTFLKSPD